MSSRKEIREYKKLLGRIEELYGFDESILSKFARLIELLESRGAEINLTTVAPEEMPVVHFEDSLAALKAGPAITTARRACDIGSGAGFPLLPLALALPDCKSTGIESVGKKCAFIREAAEALELKNVTVECARAEDAGRSELRDAFDIVTARAVGPVTSLCEVGLPLVRPGGTLLLYKTSQALDEIEIARESIRMLGGAVEEPIFYELPNDRQQRCLLRIRKSGNTPEQYPRRAGVPFKKPLAKS